MELVLESKRLLLRPLSEVDLDIRLAIYTDPDVMRYAGGVFSRDEVIRRFPSDTKRRAGGPIGTWCVIEHATNEKLGTAILLPLPTEERDISWDLQPGEVLSDYEIEVGFLLKRSAWGKGYATEACQRLLKFAFEKTSLQEIVAATDIDNIASKSVLKKCGFAEEGVRRAYAERCLGFQITRRRWREKT